ncbi:biotin--[acetyl-CoA-carboxylase] ligase [Flavobacteriales bacterium]|nr:biotin--[acetyl-CoA-carboxylase] ligase [Flavobacteriales bacterium]
MDANLFIGKKIIELESVDSTNNYLSKYINETNVLNGSVILAHNQTKGRGQRGNQWESEDGKNLTFSIYLKTNFISINNNFLLSMAVCNALHELVLNHCENTEIKWPNDILVSGKKIAGILIENTLKGVNLNYSIIGIGLNVNQSKYNQNNLATSLLLESKIEQDKQVLLNNYFKYLEIQIRKLELNKIEEIKMYYFSNLIGFKTELDYLIVKDNIQVKGEIINVKNNGFLVMKINRKEIREFEMKEVKLLK